MVRFGRPFPGALLLLLVGACLDAAPPTDAELLAGAAAGQAGSTQGGSAGSTVSAGAAGAAGKSGETAQGGGGVAGAAGLGGTTVTAGNGGTSSGNGGTSAGNGGTAGDGGAGKGGTAGDGGASAGNGGTAGDGGASAGKGGSDAGNGGTAGDGGASAGKGGAGDAGAAGATPQGGSGGATTGGAAGAGGCANPTHTNTSQSVAREIEVPYSSMGGAGGAADVTKVADYVTTAEPAWFTFDGALMGGQGAAKTVRVEWNTGLPIEVCVFTSDSGWAATGSCGADGGVSLPDIGRACCGLSGTVRLTNAPQGGARYYVFVETADDACVDYKLRIAYEP